MKPEEEWDKMFDSELRKRLEDFRNKYSLNHDLSKYMDYLKRVPPHSLPFPCSDPDLIRTYGDMNRKQMDEIRRDVHCKVGFLAVNERIRKRIAEDIWKIAGLEGKI